MCRRRNSAPPPNIQICFVSLHVFSSNHSINLYIALHFRDLGCFQAYSGVQKSLENDPQTLVETTNLISIVGGVSAGSVLFSVGNQEGKPPTKKMAAPNVPALANIPSADQESYEEQNVHEVYQQIASHFSSTRYKVLPLLFLPNSTPPRYSNCNLGILC